MALLIAVLIVLGGCYAPDVRDCALACTADSDCVQSQTCTNHVCAAAVGDCGGAPDARTADARTADAGTSHVTLAIHISGAGTVTIQSGATCDVMDCMFQVLDHVPLTLLVTAHGNHTFEGWQDPTCMNASASCTFTPMQPSTAVSARFK